MDRQLQAELHALEEEFGLAATEILDVINRRNRCKIAVRGAIAEAHLIKYLQQLQERGQTDRFEDFDIDGHPDCQVDVAGRSFLMECKNVEKGSVKRVTVDFQRTRNPIGKPWERYYLPSEFDIVAACLWNYDRTWRFRFAATADIPRHHRYADRLGNRLVVEQSTGEFWTDHLPTLLRRMVAAGYGQPTP